jgi:uncharacterized repeat protein (TIGR01451 family)
MRTTWKRAAVALLIAGAVGGAALGLARPGDPPAVIPHTDDTNATPAPPADDFVSVVQARATEQAPKNDPAVALEWSGPAVVRANQPTEYTLTVRNVCGQALQKVVLQVRAPKGTEITGVSPAVKPIDGVYLWELDTLDAKTSKSVTVTLKQPAKGDMTCQAWVTFTGTSAMKAVVKEPKLAVTMKAPEKVGVGDRIVVEYAVTNTGDYPAEEVRANFNRGLPSGTWILKRYDVSERVRLKPGESHTGKEVFTADSPGTYQCQVRASGVDGLSSQAETTVQVVAPKLDVSVSGPKERLIGTKGKYTVTVKNAGEIAVGSVAVQQVIPAGFKVSQAGDANVTGETLRWFPGELTPGASKSFEFEGVTHTAGSLTLKAVASGDRNTKASGECVTAVEGIPGLRMELVDSADPVAKNGEITYEIKVTNTGTKADSNVVIVCDLPKELVLEFVSCSGPTKGEYTVEKLPPVEAGSGALIIKSNPVVIRRSVTFDPISDLAPKTEAIYKVKVKGVFPGDVRFKAMMTSKHLTTPVTKEESTRVYGE